MNKTNRVQAINSREDIILVEIHPNSCSDKKLREVNEVYLEMQRTWYTPQIAWVDGVPLVCKNKGIPFLFQ